MHRASTQTPLRGHGGRSSCSTSSNALHLQLQHSSTEPCLLRPLGPCLHCQPHLQVRWHACSPSWRPSLLMHEGAHNAAKASMWFYCRCRPQRHTHACGSGLPSADRNQDLISKELYELISAMLQVGELLVLPEGSSVCPAIAVSCHILQEGCLEHRRRRHQHHRQLQAWVQAALGHPSCRLAHPSVPRLLAAMPTQDSAAVPASPKARSAEAAVWL